MSPHIFFEHQRDGVKHLAVRIAKDTKRDPMTSTGERKTTGGYIIREGVVTPWEILLTVNINGRCILGNPFEGISLADLLTGIQEKQIDYSRLKPVFQAFRTLADEQKTVNVHIDGVLLADDDSVLILDDDILKASLSVHSEIERITRHQMFNYPDFSGVKALGFTCASLFYTAITGTTPFQAATHDSFTEELRGKAVVPPIFLNHRINQNVSDILVHALKRDENSTPVSMEEIFSLFTAELFQDIDAKKEEQINRDAIRFKKYNDKSFRLRVFFRKHWIMISSITGGAVIAFIVLYSMLSNIFAPPATVGMEPDEIVPLYYQAINDLNNSMVEDCQVKGINDPGKSDLNLSIHLYVMGKQREGFEGRSGYYSGEEYAEMGFPDLKTGDMAFGNYDLQITELADDVFEASYFMFYTESGELEETPSYTQVLRVKDTLSFVMVKDNWYIGTIDRKILEELTLDEFRADL